MSQSPAPPRSTPSQCEVRDPDALILCEFNAPAQYPELRTTAPPRQVPMPKPTVVLTAAADLIAAGALSKALRLLVFDTPAAVAERNAARRAAFGAGLSYSELEPLEATEAALDEPLLSLRADLDFRARGRLNEPDRSDGDTPVGWLKRASDASLPEPVRIAQHNRLLRYEALLTPLRRGQVIAVGITSLGQSEVVAPIVFSRHDCFLGRITGDIYVRNDGELSRTWMGLALKAKDVRGAAFPALTRTDRLIEDAIKELYGPGFDPTSLRLKVLHGAIKGLVSVSGSSLKRYIKKHKKSRPR